MRPIWFAVRYGKIREVHVIPACDVVPHTIPMCWCKPERKPPERLYSHHAMDGRP